MALRLELILFIRYKCAKEVEVRIRIEKEKLSTCRVRVRLRPFVLRGHAVLD